MKKTVLILVIMLCSLYAEAGNLGLNYFSVENQLVRKGQVTMLPVEMVNADGIVSFQCDVTLPAGITVPKKDGAFAIETSDRFDNTHTLSSSQLADGRIRIVSISMQNHAYVGNDGVLFSIPVEVDDALAESSIVSLSIGNIQLTTAGLEKVVPDAVTANLTIGKKITPGDVNGDDEFTILDASMVVAYILQQDPVNGIREAADVNGDGEITALDVTLVVSYVLEDKKVAKLPIFNRITKLNSAESAELQIKDGKVYLSLPDASRFVAGQFALTVPEGVDVSAIKLVSENASSHLLAWNKTADGTIMAVFFSVENQPLMGDELIEISYESNGVSGDIVASNVLMTGIEDDNVYECNFGEAIATTELSGISSATDGLQISVAGNNLIINSNKAMSMPLTSVDGKNCMLEVKPGSNIFNLNSGFYIVNNKKVFINY